MINWLKNKLAKKLCQSPKNQDELIKCINKAQLDNVIDIHSLNVIEKTLQLEKMQVRDVMVPLSKMVTVEQNIKLDELLKKVVASSHSRFPVVDNNDILGMLLAKDILNSFIDDGDKFNFKESLRSIIIVPESKRLSVLLKEFQQKKSHMAVVLDEYESISGLITLEDILEQIVGDIDDEYDLESDNIIAHKDKRFLVKAQTPLDEFNEFFKTEIKSDVDTISGLVVHAFGYLPKQLESITISDFDFKVLQTDSRRIYLLEVIRREYGSVD
ncbi:Magnesium and cobalt efflux protein CorC [hydrothermal vent metagenome]|uniref:Magnesium and cobalt efflux protein CorC n=1 Tax=hydrothermal vent metagenome TaxID=652676 RepID=A0A1W1C6F7_9ZZZZ